MELGKSNVQREEEGESYFPLTCRCGCEPVREGWLPDALHLYSQYRGHKSSLVTCSKPKQVCEKKSGTIQNPIGYTHFLLCPEAFHIAPELICPPVLRAWVSPLFYYFCILDLLLNKVGVTEQSTIKP